VDIKICKGLLCWDEKELCIWMIWRRNFLPFMRNDDEDSNFDLLIVFKVSKSAIARDMALLNEKKLKKNFN